MHKLNKRFPNYQKLSLSSGRPCNNKLHTFNTRNKLNSRIFRFSFVEYIVFITFIQSIKHIQFRLPLCLAVWLAGEAEAAAAASSQQQQSSSSSQQPAAAAAANVFRITRNPVHQEGAHATISFIHLIHVINSNPEFPD